MSRFEITIETLIHLAEQKGLYYIPKLAVYQYIKLHKDHYKFIAVGEFKSFGNTDLCLTVEPYMVLDRFTDEALKVIKDTRLYYSVVFTSKDECQKYCNYLNEKYEIENIEHIKENLLNRSTQQKWQKVPLEEVENERRK